MAEIKMSYIIIENNIDEKRTTEQIILSCLDSSEYERREGYLWSDEDEKVQYTIRNKKNSQRYYLEIISKLRVNRGTEVLLHLDKCLLESTEQRYINIVRVYDGVSAAFCEKLYPKYGAFERQLRQLILLVLTKAFGINWRNETIPTEKLNDMKRTAKGALSLSETLEQLDLATMESYLFDKREVNYQTFFNEKLDAEVLKRKEKDELCNLIEEMRPRSLWERNFGMVGKQETWEKQILEIHQCRNKVAHSKKVSKKEYDDINKKMNKLNKDLRIAISELECKDFENVEAVDILSSFALTVGKRMREAILENYDWTKMIENINKMVQHMVVSIKESYISSFAEAAQKNAETIKEIGKSINYISTSNYMKIAAAFESAEELNEEAKQFSKSAENF